MTFMFPVQEYLLVGPTVHSSDNKFWGNILIDVM